MGVILTMMDGGQMPDTDSGRRSWLCVDVLRCRLNIREGLMILELSW